jgi:transposase
MLTERNGGLNEVAAENTAAGRDEILPRRSWPVAEKRRIVEESFQPGASVSIVARRNNMNANQLFSWRRCYRRGDFDDVAPHQGLSVPADFIAIGVIAGPDEMTSGSVAVVAPSLATSVPPKKPERSPRSRRVKRHPSVIEVDLPTGARLRVDASVDEAALRRVLAAMRDMP